MSQTKYSLDKTTWLKIGRGALIAGGGAVLTYISEQIPNINFGDYTTVATAVASIVVNSIWQFIKGDKTGG